MIGAIVYFFIDRYIERKSGAIAQLLGMVSDFVSESVAMGAVFSQDSQLGILLAIMIVIQNLPESFNAYLELKSSYSHRKGLMILFLLSLSGVASEIVGYFFSSGIPKTIGALMLFSSAGMIYLIFSGYSSFVMIKKKIGFQHLGHVWVF